MNAGPPEAAETHGLTRRGPRAASPPIRADPGPLPTGGAARAERVYRWVEFGALFWVMPVIALVLVRRPELWGTVPRPAALPLFLWSAFAACLGMLWFDPTFDRTALWRWRGLVDGSSGVRGLIGRWAACSLALAGLVFLLAPDNLFAFARAHPQRWGAIVVLYPWLSVVPQGVVYRSFIFHRYRELFDRPGAMVWASTLAFAWSHVIFQSWLALALTFVGGWFFATTYARARSGAAASFEHALYGCMVFTVGLGRALYLG